MNASSKTLLQHICKVARYHADLFGNDESVTIMYVLKTNNIPRD